MNIHTAKFIAELVYEYHDEDSREIDNECMDYVNAAFHIVTWKGYSNYGVRRRLDVLNTMFPSVFEFVRGKKVQAIGNENGGDLWYMYGGGIRNTVVSKMIEIMYDVIDGNDFEYDYRWQREVKKFYEDKFNDDTNTTGEEDGK